MFDMVVVGHFAIDLIIPLNGTKPRRRLGGPPTYVSLSAIKLDSSVSVISKVGGDFPEKYIFWLRRKGVDLSGLKIDETSKTTSFLIRYYPNGGREMILKSRAPSIFIEDLLSSPEAKAIHISPIANEVSTDLIREACSIAPIVALDPQGLLRCFNNDGRMRLHKIGSLDFLMNVEVLKSSEREIKVLTGRDNVLEALRKVRDYGVDVAIATMGERGAIISYNNKIFSVPAAKPKAVLDPTGAGDAFIGAFLAEYIRGENPLWCACMGTAASSFLIEKIGPKGFGNRKEVYKRAMEVYDKALIIG